jgi:uncharacterized protein
MGAPPRGLGLRSPCGVGLGLRRPFARELFAQPPAGLAFLEIHPENYLARGGAYRRILDEARERHPILTHSLTFGFANAQPYAREELGALARLVRELGAPIHSDHLCFAAVDGQFAHELLPVPRTEEAVAVAAARIAELSDALGQPVAIEPVSFYFDPAGSVMGELEFVRAVLDASAAGLLLDVNNVYVNAKNQGFDPYVFIDALPLERVVQLHVAGHDVLDDGMLLDTHAAPLSADVLALFEHTLVALGRPVPVLLERDDNFPAFGELAAEVELLASIYARVQARAAQAHAPGAQ